MKRRSFFFFLIFLASCSLCAQESGLTLRITPGGLKNATSREQRQTVTNLTVTGAMDDSDFYLIRDSMPRVSTLNLKEVEAHNIPRKGLYEHGSLNSVVLPGNLETIEDSALFCGLEEITFTGRFPETGKSVFKNPRYKVSEENAFCKIENDGVYSADGKIFYRAFYQLSSFYQLTEGTERINAYAFDHCLAYSPQYNHAEISIPASVRHIQANAFNNIRLVIPTRSAGSTEVDFNSYAETPPVLEDFVFSKENVANSTLYVPEKSVELYQSAPQWSLFGQITNLGGGSHIENNNPTNLSVNYFESYFILESEWEISEILLYGFDGKLISRGTFFDKCVKIRRNETGGIIKVIFNNGKTETIKIS